MNRRSLTSQPLSYAIEGFRFSACTCARSLARRAVVPFSAGETAHAPTCAAPVTVSENTMQCVKVEP